MKHATIELGEYKEIPLINVPVEATTYYCDLCGEKCNVKQLVLAADGTKFHCSLCVIKSIILEVRQMSDCCASLEN